MKPTSCHQKRKSFCDQSGDAIVFIFLSFPLLFGGWSLSTIPARHRAEVDFRSKALATTGVVTKIERSTQCYSTGGLGTGCTTRCNVSVRFENRQGEMKWFWDGCNWRSMRENQRVPVLYDPTVSGTHQVEARIDRGDSPNSRARTELITSLCLVLIGIVSLTFVLRSEKA